MHQLSLKKKNPIIHDKTTIIQSHIYYTLYPWLPSPSCNNPNTSLQDQFVTHNEQLYNNTTT